VTLTLGSLEIATHKARGFFLAANVQLTILKLILSGLAYASSTPDYYLRSSEPDLISATERALALWATYR
jgi:hypothetical protein